MGKFIGGTALTKGNELPFSGKFIAKGCLIAPNQ